MSEKPNLNYLHEISGGDDEFEKKLLEIVKKELPNEINSYKKFLNENNFKQASELVHKIKHKISILGLEKSYQVAIDYEENLKIDNLNLKKEFEEILNSMVCFIKTV
ncbi:MAG: Hpt domain-containing protein [Lutibacter sp.]|uniref:Hpt domain-containing protein n=1 Tax=Lutibacter sp. TaxID=1925666 RepID=UPI00179B4DAD|nr:Hpt domain-containing protein [Lutibacter sp.]MBT8316502.1 Hpt domain-containing protein [Lutibacter sp.]NNJ57362.1 Hpt domain-containing protein [Lutibacter sp.]